MNMTNERLLLVQTECIDMAKRYDFDALVYIGVEPSGRIAFCATLPDHTHIHLPELLRNVADQYERDLCRFPGGEQPLPA